MVVLVSCYHGNPSLLQRVIRRQFGMARPALLIPINDAGAVDG
jgi:hypothetical protein